MVNIEHVDLFQMVDRSFAAIAADGTVVSDDTAEAVVLFAGARLMHEIRQIATEWIATQREVDR